MLHCRLFLDTCCPPMGFLPVGNLCDPEVGLLNSPFDHFLYLKSIVCPSDQVFYKSCRTVAVSAVETLSGSAGYLEVDILRGLKKSVLSAEVIVVYETLCRRCAEVSF